MRASTRIGNLKTKFATAQKLPIAGARRRAEAIKGPGNGYGAGG